MKSEEEILRAIAFNIVIGRQTREIEMQILKVNDHYTLIQSTVYFQRAAALKWVLGINDIPEKYIKEAEKELNY